MKTWDKIGIAGVAALTVGIVATAVIASRSDYRTEDTVVERLVPPLPAAYSVSPDLERDHGPDIEAAAAEINRAAGCALLVRGEPAVIRLAWISSEGEPCGPDAPRSPEASTWYCANGTRDIRVQRLVEAWTAMPTLRHELVHALGHEGHDRAGWMASPPGMFVTERDQDELKALCARRRP